MKGFVEKLITKLEENTILNKEDVILLNELGVTFISSDKAIELVNELTEEYNNDFCEWELDDYGDYWKPNCRNELFYLRGVRKFEFCPYCSKKIKLDKLAIAPYTEGE